MPEVGQNTRAKSMLEIRAGAMCCSIVSKYDSLTKSIINMPVGCNQIKRYDAGMHSVRLKVRQGNTFRAHFQA